MNYYVKELADKSAILVAEDGYQLEVFPSVRMAVHACCEDCLVRPLWIEQHYSYLQSSPLAFEDSFVEDEDDLLPPAEVH